MSAQLQYLNLIRCISRLFGCMSLGFIARGGYGLATPSTKLLRATLLALLADRNLYGVLSGAWLLGM